MWDEDEETAIQSPHGGTKISWGGPPWHAQGGKGSGPLRPGSAADGDLQVEVDRLLSLGATLVEAGQGEVGRVVLADPDGNEFSLLTPR